MTLVLLVTKLIISSLIKSQNYIQCMILNKEWGKFVIKSKKFLKIDLKVLGA